MAIPDRTRLLSDMRRDLRNSHHLATVSFDGRFWDAYLELVEAQGPNQPARGRIAFSAADAGDAEPVRTATIFVENTAQEVLARAREFKTHQLTALLRSAEPAVDAEEGSPGPDAPPRQAPGAGDVEADPDQGEAAAGP